jgi:hypothetical protein
MMVMLLRVMAVNHRVSPAPCNEPAIHRKRRLREPGALTQGCADYIPLTDQNILI